MMNMKHRVGVSLRTGIFILAAYAGAPVQAALDDSCVVNILNRTISVGADGGWSLPNVPSNMGRIRARATCVRNGLTETGQSDYVTLIANQVNEIPEIHFEQIDPIPIGLFIGGGSSSTLNGVGTTLQLAVNAKYANGSTVDV